MQKPSHETFGSTGVQVDMVASVLGRHRWNRGCLASPLGFHAIAGIVVSYCPPQTEKAQRSTGDDSVSRAKPYHSDTVQDSTEHYGHSQSGPIQAQACPLHLHIVHYQCIQTD